MMRKGRRLFIAVEVDIHRGLSPSRKFVSRFFPPFAKNMELMLTARAPEEHIFIVSLPYICIKVSFPSYTTVSTVD